MKLTLWTLRERQGGDINQEFRVKRAEAAMISFGPR